ncbi:MAG: succinate dehydrogenase, hydrophobic membrane anchor protein [Sphingopyxis sp.]|jgi:succinate dehydrogenase / fumarate reductase membrane anchor subunit|nr:succinate dehydrogenase, hydrophobic membrane anchor protein [Sphingopyxis sp.]
MGNGTGLGKVRGLGSARSGTEHWMTQRLTAIANLVLMTWLVVSLVTSDLSTLDSLTRWLGSPFAAVPLALLVISAFTHLRLGLTVLIEDYLHGEAGKLAALVALTFFTWGGLIFALFCIAKLALGGTPNVGQ